MGTWIARGLLLSAALIAVSCAGCPPPHQRINVRSEPAGADIFLDGKLVKQTPARLELSTLSDHKVFLKKEGYRPELVVVEKRKAKDGVEFLSPPDIFVKLQALDAGGLGRPPGTTGGDERKKTDEELERERRLQIDMEKGKVPDPGSSPK